MSRESTGQGGITSVFVRKATGLVRSMSVWDILFLNIVSFGGAWSIIYALEYAPLYGGSPIVSLILTAPGILALLGVYYLFQVSMPRSGGDYVFMSRVLHPSVAFAANFAGYTFFLWFWIGDAAAVFTSQGLAQTLSVYGSLTGQQWAVNAANAFTPAVTFAVGTVAIVIFALIVMFRGSRIYFWVQNVAMTIAVLAIVLMIGLLASTNQSSFASVLNNYATSQGVKLPSGAFQNITAVGQSYWGGPAPTSAGSGYTFVLIPLWFTVLFWVFVSNYVGGETKNVKSGAKFGLFGSFGVIFLTTLAVLGLAYSNIGADFLAGAGYYAFAYGPNPFPVIPNLTLFAGIISNNAILVWFIGIGVIAGFVLVAPQCMVLMSRILFGYSFDRIMPRFVADVSDRWHTPLKGILIAAIGGEIFLALLSGVIGPSNQATAFLLYSYAGLATIGITFTFVSISAIVFPFLRKELFQTTNPAARRVAGVPVITWLGIISLIYGVVTFGYYTYNYNFYFGAGTLAATSYFPFLGGLAALFVICITWYVVVSVQRKKQGLPFERIFKEIPPE